MSQFEPSAPMSVAIVIVNYRTADLVLGCLASVMPERSGLPGLKVIVVDNASDDGSAEKLQTGLSEPDYADWVELLPLSLNGGFGWGNNQAIQRLLDGADVPEAILLLNPDTRVEPGAIRALVAALRGHEATGAVGSQLINVDGSLAASAFRFPSIGREFVRGSGVAALGRLLGIARIDHAPGQPGQVDWVTGASVLLRTRALRQAGLFDTGFFLYFEEVELMHRLRKHGWTCHHCSDSRVVHVEGAATGVKQDAGPSDQPPPPYLFASRERYFALTRGRAGAVAAVWAWLVGTLFGQVVRALTGRPFPCSILAERRALLTRGLSRYGSNIRPYVEFPEQSRNGTPGWMIQP